MNKPTENERRMPAHGRIECNRCFKGCGQMVFDRTQRQEGDWRITANPLAWGNEKPEIVVLGFSKGPTQAGALATQPHDAIAYKGSRVQVGKILKHLGLATGNHNDALRAEVDGMIANKNGRMHFGSLIRCTVERHDKGAWKGTGGGMLDKFMQTNFGREVAGNCAAKFLGSLPKSVKLVVMFGMGSNGSYIRGCHELFKSHRPGQWQWINDVAYTDGTVTVVHVEHFKSQGNLLPTWLGEKTGQRSRFGRLAQEAVNLKAQ